MRGTLHKDLLPYDYQFWADKGWIDQSFYNDTQVPWLKNRLARTIIALRASSIIKKAGCSEG